MSTLAQGEVVKNSRGRETVSMVPLGELATIIAGQSPPGETYRREPIGMPFFQGKADFGARHPVARVWCTEPNKIARPGDVLMSIRAPVGPTNVADVECCIGRGLAALRCGPRLNRDYLLQFLRCVEQEIAAKGSGSTFNAINRDHLETLEIPLPPLAEQERIAARLTEQLAAVDRARAAAQARLAAAQALPAAYLREVFEETEARPWETVRLDETCDLLPSKSISTEGDTTVRAITTACLSERGFLPGGVKTARMRGEDVSDSLVRRGEVLIARSNTSELVGRVAMYDGDPPGVVATDLTIRIWPRQCLHADYLTAFLSYLFQTGYWKAKAGGASGTMKKIRREQLLAQELRVPPGCRSKDPSLSLDNQKHIAANLLRRIAEAERLTERVREELAAIEALPAALLREAFGAGSAGDE